MTTTTTAQQELHDARKEREALEARLRAGDTTITAADLAAVDALIRFAELSIEADAQRAEDERAQARIARIAAIEKEVRALASDRKLEAARAALIDAIDTYAAEAVRVTGAHAALYREVQQLAPEGWSTSPWGVRITIKGTTYSKPDPEQTIVDATRDALKAHGHRDDIRIRKG